MSNDTIHAEIEWWTPNTGHEVLTAALAAAGDTVDPSSVHVVAGGDAAPFEGEEMSVYFTVSVPAGGLHRFYDAVRAAGFRIRDASVIPSELAHASAVEIWKHLSDAADAEYAAT